MLVTLRAETWSRGNQCTYIRKGHSSVILGLRKTPLSCKLEGLLICVHILSYLLSVLMDLFPFAFWTKIRRLYVPLMNIWISAEKSSRWILTFIITGIYYTAINTATILIPKRPSLSYRILERPCHHFVWCQCSKTRKPRVRWIIHMHMVDNYVLITKSNRNPEIIFLLL